MNQMTTMSPRKSAHVASEVDGVSKDQIVVVGGPYSSGTVLAEKADGTYTQLDITADAAEANESKVVLYGRVDTPDATPALAHCRVCSLYGDRLTWPDAITAERKKAEIALLAANHIVLR